VGAGRGETKKLAICNQVKPGITMQNNPVLPATVPGVAVAGLRVGKDIVPGAENWDNSTWHLFTGPNQIKPKMIKAATQGARSAAEKFAKDSDSQVGKIRTASPGLFSIEDRDCGSPDKKKVVTAVEYFLVDQ
jgi:hypothetical protein